MKIYTKQGDAGQTQVYAKEVLRLDKDDVLLECYGTLDELNACIGLIHSQVSDTNLSYYKQLSSFGAELQSIQQQLFAIGFAISDQAPLTQDMIQNLEISIDDMQVQLEPQTKFILPGGHIIAASTHVARTVARRAERRLVSLSKMHAIHPLALSYVNRLSDYLFVFARYINYVTEHSDIEV
jgi:cob(I)alamin adenosyltransferase